MLNSTYLPNGGPCIPPGSTQGPQDEQAFLSILSADLHSFVYSSLIGGTGIGGCGNGACNTTGIAVAVNQAGQAFIGGNTSSAHWPTTAGSFSPTCSNAGAANSQCRMVGWVAGFDPQSRALPRCSSSRTWQAPPQALMAMATLSSPPVMSMASRLTPKATSSSPATIAPTTFPPLLARLSPSACRSAMATRTLNAVLPPSSPSSRPPAQPSGLPTTPR
jgi:hypothetical protein